MMRRQYFSSKNFKVSNIVTKVYIKWGSPLLVYSLARSSFNQGSRVLFPAGLQGIVNLRGAGICFVIITGKVSWEGDVQPVTIWWQWWSLGFLNP